MTRGTLYDIPAGTVYVHVLYMLVHLSVHLIKRGREGESVCVYNPYNIEECYIRQWEDWV